MMKTTRLLICSMLISIASFAQPVKERLGRAMDGLLKDSQMRHAIMSLYVVDSKTGKVIYDHNSETGLAPASTQKIVTSAAALELLGKNFKYQTGFYIDGTVKNKTLNGNLIVVGSGDPTIGSWRYKDRKENDLIEKLTAALRAAGIEKINGQIIGNDAARETQTIPGGWIWDDIGNYYGAGIGGLNWKENQYDLFLKPGNRINDTATIVRTDPKLYDVELESELLTAAAGTGDNAYIYLPPFATDGVVRGTIPLGNEFKISGSVPDPSFHFVQTVHHKLIEAGIKISDEPVVDNSISFSNKKSFFNYSSPGLDSIVYWFLQRSVNLYGEALLKTVAQNKTGVGSTDNGIDVIKDLYKQNGMDVSGLKIMDGSGLSPQNRVTTSSLVNILRWAQSKPWYDAYYAGYAFVQWNENEKRNDRRRKIFCRLSDFC
jgi:D-alanyl-D-alanine carboxypeptidase/D-alanyl-D-alanine-endopeptidase (penicillin-binding protein 4)